MYLRLCAMPTTAKVGELAGHLIKDRRPWHIGCVERIAQSGTLFLTKHTRCPDTLGISQVRSRDRVRDWGFLSIYENKYISGSGKYSTIYEVQGGMACGFEGRRSPACEMPK